MNLWPKKIGNLILFVVGGAATLILIGIVTFYSQHEEIHILKQNELARLELSQTVIHGLTSVMLSGSAKIAQHYADELKKVQGIEDFRILRKDGREAFLDNETIEDVNWRRGNEAFSAHETIRTNPVVPKDSPHLQQAIENQQVVTFSEHSADGKRLLSVLTPIPNRPDCYRCHGEEEAVRGLVKLTTSMEAAMTAIQEARMFAVQIFIGGLVLLLTIVWFLMRKLVMERVDVVTQAMIQVARGDLTLQVPILGQDELSRMADSFNQMLAKLLQTYTGFQQERNKLATIILSAREGIIVTDSSEKVVLVNPSAERLLGKTSEQIVTEGFYQFMDDPDYITRFVENDGRDMPDTVVYNQRILSVHAARIRTTDGGIIGSAALIRDVTDEKRLEEELRFLSYTDKLTGLFNRRRMEELLTVEFDRSRRYKYFLSFMLLDVDHFKRFNDEYGHDQGDRVLQSLGKIMRDHFRKTDFPCRFGGEEFCVILTSTPLDSQQNGAWIAAERFRERVAAMDVDGLKVTISIGVACFANSSQMKEYQDLIKEADNALYEAKRGGRNRVVLANCNP